MYGPMLLALRGGGWVLNFQKKSYVTLEWLLSRSKEDKVDTTNVFVPIPRSLHFIRDAADHPYEVLLSAQLLSHRDANHAEQRSEQQLVALPELNVISGLLQNPVMWYDKLRSPVSIFYTFVIDL